MKTFLAAMLLLCTIAIICYPLYLVWYGLSADIPLAGKIAITATGVILCLLVKPISVLTGKNYKI